MTERFWNNLKWLKWLLLLSSVVSVAAVDHYAGMKRSENQVVENKRDVFFAWQLTKQIAESRGVEAFPLREAGKESIGEWESMEAFLVDAEKAIYLTKPMLESMESPTGRKLDNWTEPIKSARNGNTGVTVDLDARGIECIQGYGLVVLPDGTEAVLIVKMDVAEAISVTVPNYWDEILTAIFGGIVGLIIFFVHRHRDSVSREVAGADPYVLLIRMIRFWPDGGVALIDDAGTITQCNTGFAKLLGALGTREVIGQSIDFVTDGHADMRASLTSDIVERPVEARTLNGETINILLSVTRLNGICLARVRTDGD